MKEIFAKTTTTSIIAVLTLFMGFGTIFYLLFRFGDDATTRTQIITGVLALMYFPMQYLYGQSKQRRTEQTDSITSTTTDNAAP